MKCHGVLRWVACVVALVGSTLVPHQVLASEAAGETFRLGPDPTIESLEQQSGPFAIASVARTNAETPGFGAGTLWYPVDAGDGPFGAVAVLPGFTGNEASIRWYGPLLASHGFVVLTATTNGGLDQPPARATQFLAMLDYLASSANPVRHLVDPDRLAVIGHSMGGGGAIEATSRRPSIKASVPLTPWHTTKTWPNVQTPTLVLAAQNDTTATVASHARPLYNGLPDDLAKGYPEIRGAGHSVPTSGFNPLVARLTVSWIKRFVDDDLRYEQFHCPIPDDPATYSEYWSTCPYWVAPPVERPGKPVGLSVSAGDGEAVVTWSAPDSDGGDPLTGYRVEQTLDPLGLDGWQAASGGCAAEVTTASVATACVAGGLANGIPVWFQVSAQNGVGDGQAQRYSAAVVPTGRPLAPTVTSVAAGDGQVSVGWSPPLGDGGDQVVSYIVESVPGGNTCVTVDAAALTCVVTGLENGTTYVFVVRAVNSNGAGEASPPSQEVMPAAPPPPPGPPLEVRVVAGDGLAMISWQPPETSSAGTVTGYVVVDQDGNTVCETTSATQCAAAGLDSSVTQWFRVIAMSDAGMGTPSSPTRRILPGACGRGVESFPDVGRGAFFAKAAECLLELRITTNNPFNPSGTVNRGQMAAFMWRLVGEPEGPSSCGFRDEAAIPGFAREGACWLLATGVTTNNPYKPLDPVNRGQMAAFLWRLAGEPEGPSSCGFRDEAAIPEFAREGACWLLATGVTTNNPYKPLDPVNRGQMAAFLYRTGLTLGLWAAPVES